MKISFSISSILGNIVVIVIPVLFFIIWYDPAILLSKESKNYNNNVKDFRILLTLLTIVETLVYLGPLEGHKQLTKKRTINLTPWKNGN